REKVGRDPNRRGQREDVVPACDVLLEDVVLDGAAEPVPRDALPFGDELVEEQEERRGRVDRHRGGGLAERDPAEQELHVGERVDRDARPADLAGRPRVVGVVAELRREVERDGEAGLAALEQVAEAFVRLLGRAEAGVLADRPRPAAVHVPVGPAGERELARQLEVEVLDLSRGIDRLQLDPGVGLAPGGHAKIVCVRLRRVPILLALVAAGCGSHERVVAWRPLPPSTIGPTPRAVVPPIPRGAHFCDGSTIRFARAGGEGENSVTWGYWPRIENRGRRTCALRGRPTVTVLATGGQPVAVATAPGTYGQVSLAERTFGLA